MKITKKSKTLKLLFWTATFLILNTKSIYGQPEGDMPPNTESGKCYAKCLIPTYSDPYNEIYFIATEDTKNIENQPVEYIDLLKNEDEILQKIEWINRSDELDNIDDPLMRNELSFENTFDLSNLRVIRDTTGVTNFETIEVTYEEISVQRAETEWREVICNERVNTEIIQSIREKLLSDGYVLDRYDGDRIDRDLREALKEFQRNHHLPIGQLDIATLNKLKIDH
ncbi:MAG: peptidoglycan-binding domain-containing protein [Bacteroidota bacterium]